MSTSEALITRCRQGRACVRDAEHCRTYLNNRSQSHNFPHHVVYRPEETWCTILAWAEAHGILMRHIYTQPATMGFTTENDALAFKMRFG